MGKLEGKISLITGGNAGIGFATAKQFVKEGPYVFITGRREPETAAAVSEIGRNLTGVQGDVSKLGDLDRLFDQIKREKGRLDIVFANAGVAVVVNMNGGDDTFTAANGPATLIALTVDGGAGNDTITGGAGDDTLLGGAADDILIGGDATTSSTAAPAMTSCFSD
jgi:NAD(P)-dependent dehydrogenase (short-subunit alcohol dehydrogenase family)